jgi:hypothetical protein
MKTLPSASITLGLLNLCAIGFLALKLSKVEALVAVNSVTQKPTVITADKPSAPAPSSAESRESSDPLAGLELKQAADIIPHINRTVPGTGIEGLARALAEMDGWQFRPEDEDVASRELEGVADSLRDKIAARIVALSKSAVEAANGKSAMEKMGKINSLLTLYPAPKTAEQRTKLEQFTSGIMSASRRVEDIRRLRYNAWAIDYLEGALFSGYYNNKKIVGTDQDALTKSCIASLKIIDPAFLEPATLDLYNYVFGLTRDAVSDEFRVKLARGLADAATIRKTPLDF